MFYGDEYAEEIKPVTDGWDIENLAELEQILRECWGKDTAYPRCQAEWTPSDPTYGQCAVTAMLVYDVFGGTIHRIRTDDGGTHYFNKINGHYIDLTREQFDLYDIPVEYEPNEEMAREYCGRNPDTKQRYERLVERVKEYLAGNR